MGKTIVIIIGVVMGLLGLFGTYNAIVKFNKPPEVKSDLTADGFVTEVFAEELRHQVGITLDTTYKFNYAFVAEDGERYTGGHTINKVRYNVLSQGHPVTVKYHSDNPYISSAVGYGHYLSVDDMPDTSPTFKLLFSLGFFAAGMGVIFCGARFVVD